MPYFEVEVNGHIRISSAKIRVEADDFDDARRIVLSTSYYWDDMDIYDYDCPDLDVDWVNCQECGGEEAHDDSCEYNERKCQSCCYPVDECICDDDATHEWCSDCHDCTCQCGCETRKPESSIANILGLDTRKPAWV